MTLRAMGAARVLLLLALAHVGLAAPLHARAARRETPFVVRRFQVESGGRWLGDAIAYGPHRDGQRPQGESPTRAQVRADLALLAPHWGLLRIYGARGTGDTVLAAIRESGLGTKVVLGLWLAAEDRRDTAGRVLERLPAARADNRREIEAAVRLVREYHESILGLAVGNETQVYWSGNRLPGTRLVEYLR